MSKCKHDILRRMTLLSDEFWECVDCNARFDIKRVRFDKYGRLAEET